MCSAFGTGHGTNTLTASRMRHLVTLFLCMGVLGVGCSKPQGTILGKPPKEEPRTILAVRAGDTPPQVTLSGVMFEKCPTAGCWFRLRDETGTIKVDTKSAGFVVVNVPVDSRVTVAGKIVSEGNDLTLEATGLRF
jgi:uncharacterized protein YdeI (BOF family)